MSRERVSRGRRRPLQWGMSWRFGGRNMRRGCSGREAVCRGGRSGILWLWQRLGQIQGEMLPGVHSCFLSRRRADPQAEHETWEVWNRLVLPGGARHFPGGNGKKLYLHWKSLSDFVLSSLVIGCFSSYLDLTLLPQRSTWNETVAEEGEVVCHKTEFDLVDCEVLVDYNYEDKPLYCCKDRDCYFLVQNPEDFDDYDIFDVHTVIPSKAKACKKGATWSVRANRCVETFGKK